MALHPTQDERYGPGVVAEAVPGLGQHPQLDGVAGGVGEHPGVIEGHVVVVGAVDEQDGPTSALSLIHI